MTPYACNFEMTKFERLSLPLFSPRNLDLRQITSDPLLIEIKTELPIFSIFSKIASKQDFSFIECKIECFKRDDLKVVRFQANKV